MTICKMCLKKCLQVRKFLMMAIKLWKIFSLAIGNMWPRNFAKKKRIVVWMGRVKIKAEYKMHGIYIDES